MTTVRDNQLKNRIAKSVFSAAESAGLQDRSVVEDMIEQVIERLDWMEPMPGVLPGWESLVPQQSKGPKISEAEIQAKVKEVLAEISLAPVRKVSTRPKASTAKKARQKDDPIVLSTNARVVLERRYLKKDKDGKPVETVEDLFRRVAGTIVQAEKIYNPDIDTQNIEDEFYRLMAGLEFLPNSPTLMNAGRDLGQLSACFVLPIAYTL